LPPIGRGTRWPPNGVMVQNRIRAKSDGGRDHLDVRRCHGHRLLHHPTEKSFRL